MGKEVTDRITDDAVEQFVIDWFEKTGSGGVEAIELLRRLGDELATQPDDIELTDAQRFEFDRRLDDYQRHPTCGVSWESLRDSLRRAT